LKHGCLVVLFSFVVLVIAGDEWGTDVITGTRYRLDASFEVPANTALILELTFPGTPHAG
jgi:hypothetical protein